MKKREHRLFIRVTDEERNCILDKMYGMGIHSLSAYIRKMALDGYGGIACHNNATFQSVFNCFQF